MQSTRRWTEIRACATNYDSVPRQRGPGNEHCQPAVALCLRHLASRDLPASLVVSIPLSPLGDRYGLLYHKAMAVTLLCALILACAPRWGLLSNKVIISAVQVTGVQLVYSNRRGARRPRGTGSRAVHACGWTASAITANPNRQPHTSIFFCTLHVAHGVKLRHIFVLVRSDWADFW